MIAENLNCSLIKLKPQAYEQGYNTGILKELQITAKYNDGDAITKNINLLTLPKIWGVTFVYGANVYVKQVYAKNVFTNQLFPLLDEPILHTVNTLTALADLLEQKLIDTLYMPDAQVNCTLGTITVTGLNTNIVMDSVVTTLFTVENNTYFTFMSSDDVILANDTIYLRPSFFEFTTDLFPNGVCSITCIVTTTDDILIQESTCIFIDYDLKILLLNYINTKSCDPLQNHLSLMHYTLSQASGYACDCDAMYDIYSYLSANINETIVKDCGC